MDNILEPQIKYVDGLSSHIKDAIFDYTYTEFVELNERLRNNSVLNSRQLEIIDLIDTAFDNVPVTQTPIMLYRGVRINFRERLLSDINSYVSTSYDLNVAKSFTGKQCCLLKIIIPPGSSILPIEGISRSPNEREVLLPRYGKLVITNTNIYSDQVKNYDLVYIPEASISLIRAPENPSIKISDGEIEHWVSRILSLISPEELEIFGPNAAVDSIISTSFRDFLVPSEAIHKAKQCLEE